MPVLVRALLSSLSLVHLAFAFVLLGLSLTLPDRSLTITMRRQFDDWDPLFRLYRSADPTEAMRPTLMHLAWCNTTLPPATVRAPYCDCISLQHTLYLQAANATLPVPASLRESAVRGLVRCLGARPVWRVWPVWSVDPLVPALYVLLVAACFLWVAADLAYVFTRWPLWAASLAVAVALLVHSPHQNCLWAITVPLIPLLVEFVMLPGMADQPLAMRAEACFWWCEYVCAPVFSIFVPLMHGGRDAACIVVAVALGSTLGALGLRSFWCAYAYANTRFAFDIHVITAVTTALVAAALLSLTAVYYNPDIPFALGRGSVALLALTAALPLLQSAPLPPDARLVLQALLALARNITLFILLLLDLH